MKIILIIFYSMILGSNNLDLLNEMDNKNIIWSIYDEYDDGMLVYNGLSSFSEVEFIRIEQEVNFTAHEIFNVILDLESYNYVINNNNITSALVSTNIDSLYGYQLISNMIPFVRNRDYIFKMYKVSSNKIEWHLIKPNDKLYDGYNSENINRLTYGAGTWEYKENNLLVNTIYVDDEVNMPSRIVKKFRVNSVVDIFNDIINHLNKQKEKD